MAVQKDHQLFTPQINHMSLRLPSSPMLSQLSDIAPGVICNESTVTKNCKTDFCDCTYTLDIPLGNLVELILIDEGTLKRRKSDWKTDILSKNQ